MTNDQCHERANACAAKAAQIANEPVALEFLKLAAHWRAIAARAIVMDCMAPTTARRRP